MKLWERVAAFLGMLIVGVGVLLIAAIFLGVLLNILIEVWEEIL